MIHKYIDTQSKSKCQDDICYGDSTIQSLLHTFTSVSDQIHKLQFSFHGAYFVMHSHSTMPMEIAIKSHSCSANHCSVIFFFGQVYIWVAASMKDCQKPFELK